MMFMNASFTHGSSASNIGCSAVAAATVKNDQCSHSQLSAASARSLGTCWRSISPPKVWGGGRLDSTALAWMTRPSKASTPVTLPSLTRILVISELSRMAPPLAWMIRERVPANLCDPP